MNTIIKYISGGIIIVMLGGLTAFVMTACTAPLIEVQVTQRVNTQSSDDPINIDSELQGSKRNKTNETSPEIKLEKPTLDKMAEEIKIKSKI